MFVPEHFLANHNKIGKCVIGLDDVCARAKVLIFWQITTKLENV